VEATGRTSPPPEHVDRRTVLKQLAASSAFIALSGCASTRRTDADWTLAERIRAGLRPPDIPHRDFRLRSFGAVAGTDCSEAFRGAIAACRAAGGGRLIVDDGRFLSGPIHLGSNMALHIAEGATIAFIPEPERYLPPVLTHWEGLELMNYSPLIYAHKQSNIAITGGGTLDGGADASHWWPWAGGGNTQANQRAARARLAADAENGVPVERRVFGDGAYLRPPFIQPFDCRNVLIEDVTIRNAPFWLIHPVLCRDVIVRGVHCESLGPNSDGCDPESCANVLIERCRFNTGDDCIAIKSGRNADGRRIGTACENIVIADCDMRAGHGGVVIGSEISGGVRNVFAENCRMSSPELQRAIRIKTNSIRGGVIEHLRYRNLTVGQVRDAIVINYYYEEGDAGEFDPIVRDIVIENLDVETAERVFQVRGYERDPVRDLRLRNVSIAAAQDIGIIDNVSNLVAENVYVNGMPYEPAAPRSPVPA
jgi:polygalacturonase